MWGVSLSVTSVWGAVWLLATGLSRGQSENLSSSLLVQVTCYYVPMLFWFRSLATMYPCPCFCSWYTVFVLLWYVWQVYGYGKSIWRKVPLTYSYFYKVIAIKYIMQFTILKNTGYNILTKSWILFLLLKEAVHLIEFTQEFADRVFFVGSLGSVQDRLIPVVSHTHQLCQSHHLLSSFCGSVWGTRTRCLATV